MHCSTRGWRAHLGLAADKGNVVNLAVLVTVSIVTWDFGEVATDEIGGRDDIDLKDGVVGGVSGGVMVASATPSSSSSLSPSY